MVTQPRSILVNFDVQNYFSIDNSLYQQQIPLNIRSRMTFSEIYQSSDEILENCNVLGEQTFIFVSTSLNTYQLNVEHYKSLIMAYFDLLQQVSVQYRFQRLNITYTFIQQQKYQLINKTAAIKDFQDHEKLIQDIASPDSPMSTMVSYNIVYAAANGEERAYNISFGIVCFNDEAFKLQFINTLNTACMVKPKLPFLRLLTGTYYGAVNLLYFNYKTTSFASQQVQHKSLQIFNVMQRDLVRQRETAMSQLDELNYEYDIYSEQLSLLQREYLEVLEEKRLVLRSMTHELVTQLYDKWLSSKEQARETLGGPPPPDHNPAGSPAQSQSSAAPTIKPTRENLKYNKLLDKSLAVFGDSYHQINARLKLQGQMEQTLAKLRKIKYQPLDMRMMWNSSVIAQNQTAMKQNSVIQRSIAITQRHGQLRDHRVEQSMSQINSEKESMFRSSCLNTENQKSIAQRSQQLSSQLKTGSIIGSSLRQSDGPAKHQELDLQNLRLQQFDVYLEEQPRVVFYATQQTRRLLDSLQGYDIFYMKNYKNAFPEQIEYLCVKLNFVSFYTNYNLSCFRRKDGTVLVLKDEDVLEVLEMMALEVKQHEDRLQSEQEERKKKKGNVRVGTARK